MRRTTTEPFLPPIRLRGRLTNEVRSVGGDEPGIFSSAGTHDLRSVILERRIAQLESELRERDEALAVRQFHKGEPSGFAREFVQAFGRIIEMTGELFSDGTVLFEHVIDPEDSADQWFVFNVLARGEFKDYKATIAKWHDEVDKIVPGNICEFRLSVTPLR